MIKEEWSFARFALSTEMRDCYYQYLFTHQFLGLISSESMRISQEAGLDSASLWALITEFFPLLINLIQKSSPPPFPSPLKKTSENTIRRITIFTSMHASFQTLPRTLKSLAISSLTLVSKSSLIPLVFLLKFLENLILNLGQSDGDIHLTNSLRLFWHHS